MCMWMEGAGRQSPDWYVEQVSPFRDPQQKGGQPTPPQPGQDFSRGCRAMGLNAGEILSSLNFPRLHLSSSHLCHASHAHTVAEDECLNLLFPLLLMSPSETYISNPCTSPQPLCLHSCPHQTLSPVEPWRSLSELPSAHSFQKDVSTGKSEYATPLLQPSDTFPTHHSEIPD